MDLPDALLVEIAARSDPATFLRLAATCKLLHGDLNEPSFLRRYRRRLRARRVFVGAFVWQPVPSPVFGYEKELGLSFVPSPAPDADALSGPVQSNLSQGQGYTPVAPSRGSHVLIYRAEDRDLCVWNPVTGRVCGVPWPTVPYDLSQKFGVYVVLAAAANPSFRLLFAALKTVDDDGPRLLHVQTFSRDDDGAWGWGPVALAHDPGPVGGSFSLAQNCRSPLVLGGGGTTTLHWLCRWSPDDDASYCWYYVLTYDVDAARATAFYVPSDCFYVDARESDMLLASSTSPESGEELMSLLVASGLEIRVWTMCRASGTARLAHRVEIDAGAMTRGMEWPPLRCGEVELLQFVDTSGILVLRVAGLGVFAMDLFEKAWVGRIKGADQKMLSSSSSSSREVLKLTGDEHRYLPDTLGTVHFVAYDMDLLYLLPNPDMDMDAIYLSELRCFNLDS